MSNKIYISFVVLSNWAKILPKKCYLIIVKKNLTVYFFHKCILLPKVYSLSLSLLLSLTFSLLSHISLNLNFCETCFPSITITLKSKENVPRWRSVALILIPIKHMHLPEERGEKLSQAFQTRTFITVFPQ